MSGESAALCDINAYMNIWYVRAHLPNADEILGEFDAARAWEKRMRAIGHGRRSELSTTAALDLAAAATPQAAELSDANDPNGRKPGDKVAVVPDDYGKVKVNGEIVALSSQHIAIRRHDPRAGEIVVHFPRAGFLVLSAQA
jgi:hypothetical protein